MELSSSVTARWNFCTLGSVLVCLLLILLFNKNDQILNLWSATTSITTVPSTLLSPPPTVASLVITPPLAVSNTPPLDHYFTSNTTSSSAPETTAAPPKATEGPPNATVEPPEATMIPPPPYNNNLSVSIQPPILAANTIIQSKNRLEKTLFDKNDYEKLSNNNKVEKKMKCNIYEGRWVYKADGKPSYMARQCPFMEEKMSCQNNKRPDLDFEKWSWEPYHCHMPLLNGTDMIEKLINKRLIFVGDSLNRNMWESLSCILYSNMPNASSKAHIHFEGAHKRTFLKAKERYNFTVEFYWTPYLVEHNKNHSSGSKVLVLDKLSPNSVSWIGADIMIFNSGMHWIQLPPKKGWDLYEYKGKLIKDMALHIAYKRGMKTWAKWVEKNVDPKKTSVFFRSISAEHLNKQKDQWCYGKTKPIMDESYVSSFPKKLIRSIEDVMKGMTKSQVKYMDITKMSQYRIDAHPSIYRYNDWRIRAKNNINALKATADCGHWCLPGIPDTWNRMLYTSLYFNFSL